MDELVLRGCRTGVGASSDMPNLVAALKKLGYKDATYISKGSLKNIQHWTEKGHPVIASVKSGGPTKAHAIVIDGVTTRPKLGKGLFVAVRDPDNALMPQYFMSADDFAKIFGKEGEVVVTMPFPGK